MKKIFAGLLLSSAFGAFADVSQALDLDLSHSAFRLHGAELKEVATRTEMRKIPGCRPGNASRECTEIVVLESEPLVEVSVSYLDGIFHDPDLRLRKQYLSFNLAPAAFSEAALTELGAARSLAARRRWVSEHLELTVSVVTRDVQVIDLRNSTFCPVDSEPYPRPGCVEHVSYKPGKKTVKEVMLSVK